MPPSASSETHTRPRVEGDRELEILGATLEVLSDVGYDRLTMDAVATRARASKATLYRRWSTKASLVIDALLAQKGTPQAPDTGSLRGDLLEVFCGAGGMLDPRAVVVFSAVLTAMHRDEELAGEFRSRVIEPKLAVSRAVYQRAIERGEVRPDLDPSLFGPALAGILLHRAFLMGEEPTPERVARVVDQIILPAATAGSHRP
ncbi:TetR/AcrR family transcriptional regulator [Nocardioides sp. GCM10027113]|uniref:TetR/AcrR family transcriptional regulator n=1 Tax=unclassified Nocardioides TaxID=2615069 RepID=UPI0036120AE1